ncbi:cystathionine beta-lyase [Candidatus Hodgkinia cicadicola]|nr:cystathionine beta-lyase [Candidatus Hodgkinia cicadicola]
MDKRMEFTLTLQALGIIYNKFVKDQVIRNKPSPVASGSTKTNSQPQVSLPVRNLCSVISILEYSDSTILTSTRLTATTLMMLCLLNPGDHVLITDTICYSLKQLCNVLSKLNINVDFFNHRDEYSLKTLFRADTKLIYLESSCSEISDIGSINGICKYVRKRSDKCIISMDNSRTTPLVYKPLIHGVDVSICNLSKYLIKRPNTDLTSISTTKALSHIFIKFNDLVDLTWDNNDLLSVVDSLKSLFFRLVHRYNMFMGFYRYLYAVRYLRRAVCSVLQTSSDHKFWQQIVNSETIQHPLS